jgi:hypothetical protein
MTEDLGDRASGSLCASHLPSAIFERVGVAFLEAKRAGVKDPVIVADAGVGAGSESQLTIRSRARKDAIAWLSQAFPGVAELVAYLAARRGLTLIVLGAGEVRVFDQTAPDGYDETLRGTVKPWRR